METIMSRAIGTILVQIKVKQAHKPCMTLTDRYYSVKEAMDLAQLVFPNALNISCVKLAQAGGVQ